MAMLGAHGSTDALKKLWFSSKSCAILQISQLLGFISAAFSEVLYFESFSHVVTANKAAQWQMLFSTSEAPLFPTKDVVLGRL